MQARPPVVHEESQLQLRNASTPGESPLAPRVPAAGTTACLENSLVGNLDETSRRQRRRSQGRTAKAAAHGRSAVRFDLDRSLRRDETPQRRVGAPRMENSAIG